ncbi:hypothetical protein [Flavobacterium sp.]|uniref:hypothetical protein n=1 Tax=Flavobacterium sp. TaxID=239 RepID=UPI003D0C4717
MEITYKTTMNKIPFLLLLLCLFTNCSKDSAGEEPTTYNYFYPTDEATITAAQIGAGTGTLDPKGITIANEKLYVANGDVLEVFNAVTLAHLKTITEYKKGTTTIPFTKISSVAVDNGRIYIGSVDSRLFVMDENTNAGISTVGNGQWWNTFVHVFGVVVKDGLVFVKEKETSIKIFETSQITETSAWDLKPIAKLNTLNGFDQVYSLDVEAGNLVVAGRDAKSYLYYDIAGIKANAAASLTEPLKPVTETFNAKPIAISFSKDWAITSENSGSANYLRLYPKADFMAHKYTASVNASDILGANPFGTIVGVAQLNDRLFLSDNTNKTIRVIKLNKSVIAEQN